MKGTEKGEQSREDEVTFTVFYYVFFKAVIEFGHPRTFHPFVILLDEFKQINVQRNDKYSSTDQSSIYLTEIFVEVEMMFINRQYLS